MSQSKITHTNNVTHTGTSWLHTHVQCHSQLATCHCINQSKSIVEILESDLGILRIKRTLVLGVPFTHGTEKIICAVLTSLTSPIVQISRHARQTLCQVICLISQQNPTIYPWLPQLSISPSALWGQRLHLAHLSTLPFSVDPQKQTEGTWLTSYYLSGLHSEIHWWILWSFVNNFWHCLVFVYFSSDQSSFYFLEILWFIM